MNDLELEKMLKDNLSVLSPDDSVVKGITPWKTCLAHILIGLFLMLFRFEINGIRFDDIFAISGYLLLFNGFRKIRKENNYFKVGFITSIVLIVAKIVLMIIKVSMWKAKVLPPLEVQLVISFLLHMSLFVCLWKGIWAVESKLRIDKHSKSAIVLPVIYALSFVIALIGIQGILALIWIAVYIGVLICMFNVYKSLELTGYAINATIIKIPLWVVSLSVVCVSLAGIFVVSTFNRYPMKWEVNEMIKADELDEMRQKLIAQGVPEQVVNDLDPADIEKCSDAVSMAVLEMKENIVFNTFMNKDEELLNIKYYAFCLDEESRRWKVIHYFDWEDGVRFYGTEAVYYNAEELINAENISGYVMYDYKNTTYKAQYYFMDYKEYNSKYWGTENDLATAFSFEQRGEKYRGYLTYEVVANDDINVSIKYYHQDFWLAFPNQTALDYGVNREINSNELTTYSKIINSVHIGIGE